MTVKNRDELEKLVRQTIQLDKRNWKAPEVVKQVRKLLGESSAVSPMNIRNYRSRGIPETVMLGAAISYCAVHDSAVIQSTSTEAELLEKAREIYERLTGLALGKFEYVCELKKSEKYPDYMDAEIQSYYRHPIVHKDFGSSILPIQIYSDVRSLDDMSYKIECFGPGLPDSSTLKARLELNETQRILDSGEIKKETKSELVCNVKVLSSADSTSYVKLTRYLKGAFRMRPLKNPKNGVDRDFAGFRVINPIRSMSLTLSFPKELFPSPELIPVQVNVWGPSTLKMDEVDYLKPSAFLAPNAPVPKGVGVWHWQSSFPLMMGMAYALTYNVKDVWSLIGGNFDEGGAT
jgi:hypothetical protein